MQKKPYKSSPIHPGFPHQIHFTMFQVVFAFTSRFLYLGNMLRGLARGVLALRNLRASHLMPTLCSPPPTHLLEAPITPLVPMEEFRTPSSFGGLIVIESPPLVLPSSIPTFGYQSSLVTVAPNRLPDLVPLLLLLAFFSGFLLLLPGLVYVYSAIANRTSAFAYSSRKISKAYSFKPTSSLVPVFSLVPAFSLKPVFRLVHRFFPTQIFSRHQFVLLASLLLLWTGPLPTYHQFSNTVSIVTHIVGFLQRCGLLARRDTQTPPLLNAIYEQILNRTVTYNKLIWYRKQTRTTTSYLELLASLAQHKLELEEEKQHRLRTQRIYSEFADSQNSLRRQLEVSRTREGELKDDLRAAEAERRELKDLIATLEASDAAFRVELTTADNEIRGAAKMFDRQSKLAAEKDHTIRSTTKDLLAVRAGLQDAEDKIARLDAELQSERDLRIRKTKELSDEQAKSQGRHEAEMRHIAKKAEDVQEQLDLFNDILSRSRARTQSLLDDAHKPRLRNHATVIAPDDTGQPPPPPLEPIPDVLTRPPDPITKPRSPFTPKSLRLTPERNSRDPTRHSRDPPRQISACLDRISDTANTWHAGVESLLETIYRLEAERVREAESRERSEWGLREELAATQEQLRATQGGLAATKEQLSTTQDELAATNDQLCALQEELAITKEQLRTTQEELYRGREMLQDMKAHAGDVKRELEVCQVKRGAPGIVKFFDAVELLRRRRADLESLRVEAEASKSKHSQALSLSAMLRKRVMVLEAEVESLNRNQKTPPAHAKSKSFFPADTDPMPAACSADIQAHDSFYMKLSTSLRSILNSSLPPSPSSNLFPSSSDDPPHTILGSDNVPLTLHPPERPGLSTTPNTPPPSQSRIPASPPRTRKCSVASSPVWSSVGSVDWPPIGSTLRPSGKNAEQDGGVGVRTPRSPPQEADHTPATSSTSRNSLNLPLAQTSRESSFGVHGSASSQLINATTVEDAPISAPASLSQLSALSSPIRNFIYLLLGYEEIPPRSRQDHSHGEAASTSLALSSPARPPSPPSSGPAQLSQFLHTRDSPLRPLHAKSKEGNLGTLGDLSDWNPSTSTHPSGSNDAGGTLCTTTPDRLGVRHSSQSASVAYAQPGRLPSSSRLHPEAVSGTDSALSSHTPPGSPPSYPPAFALFRDEATSSRSCRAVPTAQSIPLSEPIRMISSSSSRPLSPSELMPGRGVDAHALKCNTRATPHSPLPRLLPGLLDPIVIREREFLVDDSPCTFSKVKKTRRPNQRRRPRFIPTLDYGLPEDFIPGTGRVTTERPDRGLDDDFAYLIPLDCLTSTPVAISRRLALKRPLPESEEKLPSFGISLGISPPQLIIDI
ncbi:hypothetical protein EDB84DRAFT_1471687 [Lactarius hengduanensis]|nr:hypothetical protein EDB84DRAFT_1471687 [Lactarius hengduanensis]